MDQWIQYGLMAFGLITLGPLCYAQWLALAEPNSRRTKDILVGKGGEWRDQTQLKAAQAIAWADWFVLLPLFVIGGILVLTGNQWGYVAWFALGSLCVYISIFFWVYEKEDVYELVGALAYYTYFWGFFMYFGIGLLLFSAVKLR